MARPQKSIRLDYNSNHKSLAGAVSVLGEPAEARISASADAFIAVQEEGITLGGSRPAKINIQGLSNAMKYAGGMVQDIGFPLSMLPSTFATPFPKQIFTPPMGEFLDTIRTLSQYAKLLASAR